MAFKNLEQRYTERSKHLYAAATLKFDGGKASLGATDDPLITRRPGDGYWGVGEGRELPVRSTAQDVKRLTRFTISNRGLLFLAKQQLLQTGNTFAKTRLLNPTFVVGNAVPFIHITRHINTDGGLSGIAGRLLSLGRPKPHSVRELRKSTYLQEETYNNLVRDSAPITPRRYFETKRKSFVNSITSFFGSATVGDKTHYRPEIGDGEGQYFIRRLLTSIDKSTFKFGGLVKPENYIGTLMRYSMLNITTTDTTTAYLKTGWKDYGGDFTTRRRTGLLSKTAKNLVPVAPRPLVYNTGSFAVGDKFLPYFSGSLGTKISGSMNAKYIHESAGGKISYIKDPLNHFSEESLSRPAQYANLKKPQDGIVTGSAKNDIITVAFAMANDDAVQFRAFIKDINETTTPVHTERPYIGRIERYVSYTSVKRTVGFTLLVVAFSEKELETVWTKINYLTSLAYPYGVYKGILQPNIVKLTIGNIYRNQPGYVTNITSDFGQTISSWDIDAQVPHGAAVTIQFDIIEKQATTNAHTPLYGILQPQS